MQLEASTQRTMAELSDTASKAQDRLVSTSADLGAAVTAIFIVGVAS
jgi:hypothetical protein